jgi:hypothetical protein
VFCLRWVTASSGFRFHAAVYINEDEYVVLADYQVDLPAPCSVVTIEKRVTVLDQVAQREVFTPCPGGFIFQSPIPA